MLVLLRVLYKYSVHDIRVFFKTAYLQMIKGDKLFFLLRMSTIYDHYHNMDYKDIIYL